MKTPALEKPATNIALPMGRVLSFATITAAGFVLGKVSGIMREMVVSAHFGLGSGLDAYVLAGVVPTTINNIVAGSAITAAVMPTFARYLAAGRRDEFWRAASVITNIVLLVTGAVTALGMLLAGPIISLIAGASPPSTQALAATMLVIMMPTLLLGAALNMLMAMLNSVDRFAGPALIFLALNVGMIAAVILLTPIIGVVAVAWGFLIGVILQVVIQVVELRIEHPHYTWRIDWHHPALREVFAAFVPITALAITAQINLVVDKTMAASLPAGSVSALYYADVVLGAFYMLGYSLGIAVFPNLSRLAAVNDLESTRRTVVTSLRLLVFILAPLTLALMAFAAPAVGLIFERGAFDARAVQMTAQALAMYAVGLIAIAALQVLQRVYYAFSDSATPLVVGALTALAHVALNLILMRYWAHAGIALSTSITAIVAVVALVVLLERRVRGIEPVELLGFLSRCVLFALVAIGPMVWLAAILPLGDGTVARVITAALALLGGIVYLLLARTTRTRESELLLQPVWGFFRRGKA
ncbi:MAG: murein biosynthesis integral membrane protein MurJ [Chloroflexi bacterium]|nr:murein biosynthesis integral membrane protein MurJ [Chloroflexota bacterium]